MPNKQLLKTQASSQLQCRSGLPRVGEQPPWELSPQFIIIILMIIHSLHGVTSSDAPLVPERLRTLTLAPASTGIEGNLPILMGSAALLTSP